MGKARIITLLPISKYRLNNRIEWAVSPWVAASLEEDNIDNKIVDKVNGLTLQKYFPIRRGISYITE